MSLQVEKLENNMAKLTIEVPADDLEKALQSAYMKQKNKIAMPGFRKGKVPRQMIEKMYGPEIFYDDAANALIPKAYSEAYDECDLEIVSRPEINIVQIEKGKSFIFTADVATKPEVKLGEYKGLEVDKVSTRVTQKEVDAKIQEEAEKNASLTEEELAAKKKKEDRQFKWLLYITVAISIVVSIAAFMLLPYALASLCRKVGASEVVVTIVEAFVKLGLFMGYMILISRMKDIQRTFMYHGAEHKCINCVENGKPLTVENVLESSRFHRRCGTSFLFLVMIVSIFLHFIFVLVPSYWFRLFGRLLMVPVVSGISFEIIQWAGRTDSKFALMMSKPGMAMQKFTTKEPTADMAEVAIKAVEAVFDWRAYLKTEFNLDIPYENKENGDFSAASAQSESGDSEERTGNVPETGAAQ